MELFKKWSRVVVIDSLILLFVASVVSVLFLLLPHSKIKISGIYLDTPRNIADFALRDQNGRPFTKQQLKGHWTILFFGYTHCPMVCPTTFSALNQVMTILRKQLPSSQLPQIVFISIDPKNDTPPRLNHYIKAFNPDFIGLTGEGDKVTTLEKTSSYNTVKITEPTAHNTDILLLNPNAQIQAYFLFPHRAAIIANDYQMIVTGK